MGGRKRLPKVAPSIKVASIDVQSMTAEEWRKLLTVEMQTSLRRWRAKNPLRLWRESVGKSQSELAADMGRSRQQVHQWEEGLAETAKGLRQYVIPSSAMMELHRLHCPVTIGQWADWWGSKPSGVFLIDRRLRQPMG